MPGSLPTSARRWPVIRLKRADLPTLGRPSIAMRGSCMMKWRFPPDPLCYSLRGLGERQSLIDKWAVKMASGVAKACFYALIAALAFRAASTIIGAQDDRPNGGSTDSQKPLVLRKTVRMVQVPVVVKDSS